MKAYHSPLKVYPTSWDKKVISNLKKDWEIRYTYFCDAYPQGKVIRFKGMNHCKTLEEKQKQTRLLLENESKALDRGFNPITREYENYDENLVTVNTPFYKSLEILFKGLSGVKSTLDDYENSLKHIHFFSTKLELNNKEIGSVTKGDMKQLLMRMSLDGHSNYRVNKTRDHLSKFFSLLTELDIFPINFITGINKLEHQSAQRSIIRTEDEWRRFHSIKDINFYEYAFLYIFLLSGCRFTEMAAVKKSDVDITKGIFWINLKKGGKHRRALRPINMEVWNLWKHYCDIAANDDYLFSINRMPNSVPITANSLYDSSSKILKMVGLNHTGYNLKGSFLNMVAAEYGITKAKELAGHTNEKTTKIYAVDYEEHLVEQNRKIKINTK